MLSKTKRNILDTMDTKKEEDLFRQILKIHGLLKCKSEDEYIEALQFILDRGLSYDINDYVSDVTNVYLRANKIKMPKNILN